MRSVLVLDDQPAVLRSTARLLERMGHAVVTADTCAAAHALEGHFDVAILDIELPDGSGIDVGRVLLAEGRVGKIVFFSGRAGADVAGLGSFVLKSNIEGLRQAVAAAVMR